MPLIEVKMTEGRSKEVKVKLMKEITKVVADIAECPIDAISVIIDDSYRLDEWSVGGQTWEEKIKG